jgi:16S rRNA (cytidine1402-2'-O)-methyltransferase
VLIFYEAPHRILEALTDIETVLGPRPLVLARELTKIHEEFLRGTPEALRQTLAARGSVKGEFTVLIGKATISAADTTPIHEAVEAAMQEGMPRMEAMKTIARRRGISKREVYRALEDQRH